MSQENPKLDLGLVEVYVKIEGVLVLLGKAKYREVMDTIVFVPRETRKLLGDEKALANIIKGAK